MSQIIMNWIPVDEKLPNVNIKMGLGNTCSEDCLITDGENYYVGNLECIRPDFIHKVWSISASDKIVKEYSGKDVTHWMPLPLLPNKSE